MKSIDLGQKMPSTPIPVNPVEADDVVYPHLYIDSKSDLKLPDEGTMTIRYCVERRTTTETEGGEKSQSLCIEVQEIVDVEAAPDSEDEDNRGDILDSYAKEVSDKKKE